MVDIARHIRPEDIKDPLKEATTFPNDTIISRILECCEIVRQESDRSGDIEVYSDRLIHALRCRIVTIMNRGERARRKFQSLQPALKHREKATV